MRSMDLAWLAGLFEGEGSIGLRRGYQPVLQLDMTDEDVVNRVLEVAGVGAIGTALLPSGKTVYRWRVTSSRDAAALLMTMLPLLGERRSDRARQVLLAWRDTSARRRGAWRCGRGHEMTPENTNTAEGRRRCRRCQSDRAARYRQKAS